jgi:hypothetical protein
LAITTFKARTLLYNCHHYLRETATGRTTDRTHHEDDKEEEEKEKKEGGKSKLET